MLEQGEKMRKLGVLFLLLFSQTIAAGNFDCSVVYDEYDSLMNKNFIVNPSNYVRTEENKISRFAYNSRQKGQFTLKDGRKGMGIATFRTNSNSFGKFLYTWGAPFNNGNPSLILKDVVVYGRVMDGYRPRKIRKIIVPSSYTVDLDTFQVGATAESDIWFHNINGRTMFLETRNGADLHFPMESMCQ